MQPGDQHNMPLQKSVRQYIPPPQVITPYTAAEIATLQSKLDQQLGPEFISSRPGAGGKKVHYLQADKCINLANQVFGFNGWSSCITNMEVDFLDPLKDGKFNIGISVTVRVTLKDGTYHEDIGYGQMENAKKAQAFEKAKKEGTTDALKRALRSFGNVLGNCLYDKEYLSRITRVRAPTAAFDEKRLHRHGDSMPVPPEIKKESGAPFVPNVQAAPTSASTSDESVFDDYGGDDLEELGIFAGDETYDDLMPDEVAIDDSPPFDTPSKPPLLQPNNNFGRNTLAMPQQPSAPTSPTKQGPRSFAPPPQTTAAIRPQTNGAQAQQQQQQQPKPQPPQPPQQKPSMPAPAPRSNMQPPSARPQTNLPGPATANRTPAIGAPRPNVPGNNAPNPSNANSAAHPPAPQAPQAPPTNKPTSPNQSAGAQPQAPTTPGPPNPPIGFFTARAAMSLNSENDVIPEAAPTFNPHKVTSIPRTAGIDHTKSSPIPRKVLGQASQGPPPIMAPSPMNFQNPSMAPVRQIGMPPRGTGAFKSPSMAGMKRGPQGGLPPPGGGGLGGSSDIKRPRNGA
ncbi:RAD52 DNA repair protein [Pyronema omphalodes]|nr:RAD52 DNA repair protein [Pyronema omphalodes]